VARRIVAEEQARRGDTVRLALTGEAAMNAEELQTVSQGAAVAGVVSFVLVTLVIFLGFPAVRFVLPAVVMLVLGILMTAGFATVTVGYLNLISVAFAVLFIGLGVDYAVHVILRYNEEAKHTESVIDALTSERPAYRAVAGRHSAHHRAGLSRLHADRLHRHGAARRHCLGRHPHRISWPR
jgi:predicted RND superfamily exporter protein